MEDIVICSISHRSTAVRLEVASVVPTEVAINTAVQRSEIFSSVCHVLGMPCVFGIASPGPGSRKKLTRPGKRTAGAYMQYAVRIFILKATAFCEESEKEAVVMCVCRSNVRTHQYVCEVHQNQ